MKSKIYTIFFLPFIVLFNCNNEEIISFTESEIAHDESSMVEINIAVANGTSDLATKINTTVATYIVDQLLIDNLDNSNELSIKEAALNFKDEHRSFITDFPDSNQIWEAQIDGEISYQSDELITYILTSYINTGGAHGNLVLTIINMDAQTGVEIENADLFSNPEAIKSISKTYFTEAVKGNDIELFESENHEWPTNLGFNQEGLLFLYNTYEVAPHADGIIEFVIPFNQVSEFLLYN